MKELAELVLSCEDNECTAIPYWGVAEDTRKGTRLISSGIFFNRKDCEDHLQAQSHNYPKKAFVYCFSGNGSWHLKKLYELAAKILEEERQ